MTTTAQTPDLFEYAPPALDAILNAAADNGGSFTCSEADAIADLFLALDREHDAATFLAFHAQGDDDEDDRHAGWDEDDARLHVQGLAQRLANGDDRDDDTPSNPPVFNAATGRQYTAADVATARRAHGEALLREYDEWREGRADLSAQEDDGGADWSESDDAGCDLAERLAEHLRTLTA